MFNIGTLAGMLGNKGKKFDLRGVIVTYEHGIQRIKTESREREFQWIQCLGFSLIKCPKCKVQPGQPAGFIEGRPCKHVGPGTKVILTYKTRLSEDRKTVVQGYWTGRVAE